MTFLEIYLASTLVVFVLLTPGLVHSLNGEDHDPRVDGDKDSLGFKATMVLGTVFAALVWPLPLLYVAVHRIPKTILLLITRK